MSGEASARQLELADGHPSVDPSAIAPSQLGPSEIGFTSSSPSSSAPSSGVKKPGRRSRDRDRIPTVPEFIEDPEYLGLVYSAPQRALLKAIYGLELTAEERDIWGECTGRRTYTAGQAVSEATVIAGARSGKDSRIAAPLALYEALYGDYPIARGEPTVIPLVAQDGEGSEIAFGYIREYALERPRLARYVDNDLARELWLTNVPSGKRVKVKCFACSAKSIRGWSIPAAVMDEVAYFRVEGGANADEKVQRAIRRGGINFPRQRLVKISTPYLKGGVLWEDLQRYWGVDDADVLVWKAATERMNPAIAAARIERERRKDRAAARVEYDAEFADDVTTFLPIERLEAVVADGRHEVGPRESVRYLAAADPSGGGPDTFTLAIVHVEWREGRPVMVQDVMRGWRAPRGAKLELDLVVGEIAEVLRRYRLYRLVGDRYAGEWPVQKFRDKSVLYQQAERDKSAAYIEFEPWVSTGSIELLDHPELYHEASLLEKRLRPGGKKPVIDHPKGARDDHANALALAVAELAATLHPVATATNVAVIEQERQDLARDLDLLSRLGRGALGLWGGRGRERVRFLR